MRTFSFALLLTLAAAVHAQTDITGTWTRPPAEGEYFDYEGLIFTADGHYYAETVFPEDYYDIVIPESALGIYQLQGNSLSLYNMKTDECRKYRLSGFDGSSFHLTDNQSGESWAFAYRGSPQLNDNIRTQLLSWENYRRLGGSWRSAESVLKVIPSLGIVIIRQNADPGYFMWGHYSLDGNQLRLAEISAEEAVFYEGAISGLSQASFALTNEDGSEHFSYQGPLQLDEEELMMVEQYLKMNHRLSMSTIDLMDGRRDFVWEWVKGH